MNLSQLNYFKKLAEVLHYTRAAQELFITQPTLSGAISSLRRSWALPCSSVTGARCSSRPTARCSTSTCAWPCAPSTTAWRRERALLGLLRHREPRHHLHHPGPLPAEPHPRLRGGLRQAGHREGVPGIHQLPHRAAASGHAGCDLLRQARQRARHRVFPGEALRTGPLRARRPSRWSLPTRSPSPS